MGTIAYSVNGEGRGHATRVHSIVEMMIPSHRFLLLASGDAYEHLSDAYRSHPLVRVEELPGLRFRYHREKLDYIRSLASAVPFLWNLSRYVERVVELLVEEHPDLAITDFEPLLPRAAVRCGIPWISLDHQHFLSISDFSCLPWGLRCRSRFLRNSVSLFYRGQGEEIVSSFAHLPSRRGCEGVERIGILVRKAIQQLKSSVSQDGGLVVYIRHHAPRAFWDVLAQVDRQVLVFGKCIPPSHNNFEYLGIQNEAFMQHLARCEALITTAGNQLVGEAFFLGKPVLAIPEKGNFEQQVNAWLVGNSGFGWGTEFEKLTLHMMHQFLISLPLMRKNLRAFDGVGNAKSIDLIERYLSHGDTDHSELTVPSRSVA